MTAILYNDATWTILALGSVALLIIGIVLDLVKAAKRRDLI